MEMLFKLVYTTLIFMVLNFSTSLATGVFEKGEGGMCLQRPRSQFDPRSTQKYIEQEKKEAYKKGFEEGRIEETKTEVRCMLSKGIHENVIAELTDMSPQQIQELKDSLK